MKQKNIVKQTANDVFAALEKDRALVDADVNHLYSLVGSIVIPHFDFGKMSRKVVDKKTWKAASKELRAEFIQAFRAYLVRTYSTALIKFDIDKITYDRPRKNGKYILVRTTVHLKRTTPVPIQYRLYKNKSKEWKVTDIVVNGISLITNRQGTYKKIAQKKGLAGLIAVLSKNSKS